MLEHFIKLMAGSGKMKKKQSLNLLIGMKDTLLILKETHVFF